MGARPIRPAASQLSVFHCAPNIADRVPERRHCRVIDADACEAFECLPDVVEARPAGAACIHDQGRPLRQPGLPVEDVFSFVNIDMRSTSIAAFIIAFSASGRSIEAALNVAWLPPA